MVRNRRVCTGFSEELGWRIEACLRRDKRRLAFLAACSLEEDVSVLSATEQHRRMDRTRGHVQVGKDHLMSIVIASGSAGIARDESINFSYIDCNDPSSRRSASYLRFCRRFARLKSPSKVDNVYVFN